MTDLTNDELKVIAKAPMNIGLAVAMVDLGIVSAAIEMVAMSKELVAAAKKYPNNSILQSLFSEEAIKSGTFKMEKPDIKPEDVVSGALIDSAIADINSAITLIQTKGSETELTEYKQFIYGVAEAVANAAGSGIFGSGTKVTEKEAIALDKIKAALAI